MANGLAARNGGPGRASPRWSRSCCSGSACGSATPGTGGRRSTTPQAYATIAANLERGDGFTVGAAATQPSSNYSPGLPLLVAGVYELSGGVHERWRGSSWR